MRFKTVDILWHSKVVEPSSSADTADVPTKLTPEPILSLDFHPSQLVLATAGADNNVRLWQVVLGDNGPASDSKEALVNVKEVACLSRDRYSVNAVRFSPDGSALAAGLDGGTVSLWRDGAGGWSVVKLLRGHGEDVLDVCWAGDGAGLGSGSVDNTAVLWDLARIEDRPRPALTLAEHTNYVQGIAMDPLKSEYLCTQSSDASVRVYSRTATAKAARPFIPAHIIKRTSSAAPGTAYPQSESRTLYRDEAASTMFRRLSFSPDGVFLVTPCGQFQGEGVETIPTTYVYVRHIWKQPLLHLPLSSLDGPSCAVRFSPVFYKAEGAFEAWPVRPYYMAFAVATPRSVVVYTTRSTLPVCVLSNIHHAPISDLAWSYDGCVLAVSSVEGNSTFLVFGPTELGTPLPSLPAEVVEARSQATPLFTAAPSEAPVVEKEAAETRPAEAEAPTTTVRRKKRVTPVQS